MTTEAEVEARRRMDGHFRVAFYTMEQDLARELGPLSPGLVKEKVANAWWQSRRLEMLGTSLAYKYGVCSQVLNPKFHRVDTLDLHTAQVCVLNYIYALKRGGLI